MKNDDVARLIMMPIGLMSIYAVIKMNGHISKSFFPFPQIDKAVMFLWWIAPFVLAALGIAAITWASYRHYQELKEEKLAAIEQFRKEFRKGIMNEVDQYFKQLRSEIEKSEARIMKRLKELEEKDESKSLSKIDFNDSYQGFEIEKFL